MDKIQNTDTPNAGKDVKWCKISVTAVRNAKYYSLSERQFDGFLQYQTYSKTNRQTKENILLTIRSSNCTPWYLPKWAENLCPHRKLHKDIYSSFIHNCQNLEATNMSFSSWMDKLWHVHTMQYYSIQKRNELSSHEKTWRKLKWILLSERSQSEKAMHSMIPIIRHSRKGKTMETKINK